MRNFLFIILILFVQNSNSQTNVTLLSNFNPYPTIGYNDIWGYVDSQGREYALLGTQHGTSIVNVTNPTNPVEVAFIPGPNSIWRDIKVHSHYAYIVTEGTGTGRGLQIVDLSNLPNSATLVNTIETWFTRAHNIFIDNGYAYVIGTNNGGGMHILDLSNPINPTRTAYYLGSNYIHDVYVWNDTVVAAAEDSYDLIDVSNKSNPVLISVSPSLPGIYAHSGWMTEDKRYFVGTEEFDVRDVTVWDLQDRTSWDLVVPTWQMNNPTPTSGDPVHNLFIKGNYAHISYYKHGYVVLDISDPSNPFLAGEYDTYSSNSGTYNGAWGCYPYLPSGITLISDISTGLYVLQFNPPSNIPPQISHFNQSLVYTDSAVIISANISDDGQITGANLHYRTVRDELTSDWFTITDNNGPSGSLYEFIIPGQPNRTEVQYYIAAVDNDNNVSTLPEGGSGINPLGENPPPSFFNYFVKIPGQLVVNGFSPSSDTTILNNGEVPFLVNVADTSLLNITYQWFRNGNAVFNNNGNSYLYRSLTIYPAPRTDSVRVVFSNGFYTNELTWQIFVEPLTSSDYNTTVYEYNLEQNFPNPFNPSTDISFKLKESGNVKIEVFNTLGQSVSVLLDEFRTAGAYKIKFDASLLPSGIYLAKMTSGDFSKTIKMSLMK
ncbi:choice-of-anchor B family protein [Ignavibacterium sp.]|uniref:choice-of-anchor B family protein n=1 Tax=Ignavibacterium sp. TaxID=2651167 RepID=UPI00220EC4B6|nr:choice-of-anchor B family protein [Ignavibacterium sp.]BDQ01479.1 MAG: hypothetical protein KatS3mg037_0054 [Ignavibacterium sp.]